jgi:hypothetical protein
LELAKPDWRFPLPGSVGFATSFPSPVVGKCDLDFTALGQLAESSMQVMDQMN